MPQTYVRPAQELRSNYAEIAELVRENNHVIITDQGRNESVLISMEEYRRYEEYLHEEYIAKALEEAEQQAKDPTVKWLTHKEVWETLREKYAL